MKTKDLVMLLVAVMIFLVCGYVGYTQLAPKKSTAKKSVQVEVIGSIPSQMDANGMSWLANTSKVQDYDTPIDLTGVNNPAPFGQ